MDGFTDSLSQYFNSPQEMINANSQADADQLQDLKDRVDKYEGVLEKFNETVKNLDVKDNGLQENIDKYEGVLQKFSEAVNNLDVKDSGLQENINKYESVLQRISEAVNELDSKDSGLQENIDKYEGVLEKFSETINNLDAKDNGLQEHIHKENVRVYRNVQASFIDELSKQTETIKTSLSDMESRITNRVEAKLNDKLGQKFDEKMDNIYTAAADKSGFKGKAILPLQIIAMVLIVADLVINVLRILGLV